MQTFSEKDSEPAKDSVPAKTPSESSPAVEALPTAEALYWRKDAADASATAEFIKDLYPTRDDFFDNVFENPVVKTASTFEDDTDWFNDFENEILFDTYGSKYFGKNAPVAPGMAEEESNILDTINIEKLPNLDILKANAEVEESPILDMLSEESPVLRNILNKEVDDAPILDMYQPEMSVPNMLVNHGEDLEPVEADEEEDNILNEMIEEPWGLSDHMQGHIHDHEEHGAGHVLDHEEDGPGHILDHEDHGPGHILDHEEHGPDPIHDHDEHGPIPVLDHEEHGPGHILHHEEHGPGPVDEHEEHGPGHILDHEEDGPEHMFNPAEDGPTHISDHGPVHELELDEEESFEDIIAEADDKNDLRDLFNQIENKKEIPNKEVHHTGEEEEDVGGILF